MATPIGAMVSDQGRSDTNGLVPIATPVAVVVVRWAIAIRSIRGGAVSRALRAIFCAVALAPLAQIALVEAGTAQLGAIRALYAHHPRSWRCCAVTPHRDTQRGSRS